MVVKIFGMRPRNALVHRITTQNTGIQAHWVVGQVSYLLFTYFAIILAFSPIEEERLLVLGVFNWNRHRSVPDYPIIPPLLVQDTLQDHWLLGSLKIWGNPVIRRRNPLQSYMLLALHGLGNFLDGWCLVILTVLVEVGQLRPWLLLLEAVLRISEVSCLPDDVLARLDQHLLRLSNFVNKLRPLLPNRRLVTFFLENRSLLVRIRFLDLVCDPLLLLSNFDQLWVALLINRLWLWNVIMDLVSTWLIFEFSC